MIKEEKDTVVSDESTIWLTNNFRLFFSHLTEDKLFVSEIKKALLLYGVDCFVAHEDINPTVEWQSAIEIALQSCDVLVAFLTKYFHASNWTDQEIGFCIGRRILIIPIKIDLNPYGFIGKFQAKNCAKLTSSQIAEEIFNILIGNSLTSKKFGEKIVANFVESKTWEEARARIFLLTKIKNWTPELLKSIESTLETHSHIPTAFGVPERIKAILNKNKMNDSSRL